MAGEQAIHMAPPASRVPRLMADLLHWLDTTDAHPLIASSIFHHEFEFIHPFSDGNGRMGRLWQTLILSRWHPQENRRGATAATEGRRAAILCFPGLINLAEGREVLRGFCGAARLSKPFCGAYI